MAGGASGAIGMWARDAHRAARELERHRTGAREARRASRESRKHETHDDAASGPPAARCMACGFVELAPPPSDPMRTAPSADAPPDACGKCGARAWAPLGDVARVRALCELERNEIASRRGLPRAYARLVAASLFVLLSTLGILQSPFWLAVSLCTVVHLVSAVKDVRERLAVPRRRAFRWHGPSPRALPAAALVRGMLEADEAMRAPITGRTCVAWRVEVRYPGDRGDAFALVDQASVPMRVGGRSVVDPSVVGRCEVVSADGADALAYLFSRGLDTAQQLEVRELVLVAGDEVELCAERHGGPAIVRPAA